MNHFNYGLKEAKKEFYKDLKQDKDFIEFKQRACNTKEHIYYGVVIAGEANQTGCILNVFGPTSRKLIYKHLKSLKLKK